MAEQSADLCEGSALSEHMRSQRMAELMTACSGCLDPGAQDRMTDDRSYGTLTQKPAYRRFCAQEHPAIGSAGWSTVP